MADTKKLALISTKGTLDWAYPPFILGSTAAALGYEAALRIGEAVNPSHYRFWHPTGTAATSPKRADGPVEAIRTLRIARLGALDLSHSWSRWPH